MTQHNPWKRIDSKVMYQNPWITVREDQVIRPDGLPGIYGVVETKIATGVVAVDSQSNIFLIGQYRYPTDSYSWEIVEGGAEHTESPLVAIQRELQEEAGLIAEHWEQLGHLVHLSNCTSAEVALLYVAHGLTETIRTPEGTEVLTVRVESYAECLRMIEQGEITDAMSIIALHRMSAWFKTRGIPV